MRIRGLNNPRWHFLPRRQKWIIFGLVGIALFSLAWKPVTGGKLALDGVLVLMVGVPTLGVILWGLRSAARKRF